MKKIISGFALILGTMTFAQDYYDTYPQDYNGYEYYDNSYDYPDDYYYNYPADYYPDPYYQGYYNDYQRAVFSVNWDQFFVQYRLTPFQINQIIILNSRFPSFAAWDSYYRHNPDRWYYDRFLAMQNILGSRIFVMYQNVYFHGRSPIVFYRNRFASFYAVRYPVRPAYRNVNINMYRIDRNNFRNGFRNNAIVNPRNNNGSGIRDIPPRSGANGGGFSNPGNDNAGIRTPQNGGIRNNGNIRSSQNDGSRTMSFPRSNGIRNESPRNNSSGRSLGMRVASR